MAVSTLSAHAVEAAVADAHAALSLNLAALVSQINRGNGDLVIFGYASLLWNPSDIQYCERLDAALAGYRRRLSQMSPDHRGTPSALGRVATLSPVKRSRFRAKDWRSNVTCPQLAALASHSISLWLSEAPEAEVEDCDDDADESAPVVFGSVFKISPDACGPILERLAVREKAGYEPRLVSVSVSGGRTIHAVTFIGTREFTARESDAERAAVISSAVGPSGTSEEYFARLLAYTRRQLVTDVHLEALLVALLAVDSASAQRVLDLVNKCTSAPAEKA
jgi:cation transport regulator ChaC